MTAEILDVAAAIAEAQNQFPTTQVSRPIPHLVDLGNLCVFDQNIVLDSQSLKSNTTMKKYLSDNTRDGVQVLVNALWQQPTRSSEDGTLILADLPAPSTALPREKSAPKVKAVTRWEKFAKEKGIVNKKKSKLVWDEEKKDWQQRWGYKSSTTTDDWCLEVPDNADPYEDQFAKKKEEKAERITKNKKLQKRNQDTATAEEKGLSMQEVREKRKGELSTAVTIIRKSTASLGRFDKKLRNDSYVKEKGQKRHFDDNVGDISKEKEMAAKVLKKVAEAEGSIVSSTAADRVVTADINAKAKHFGEGKKRKSDRGVERKAGKKSRK